MKKLLLLLLICNNAFLLLAQNNNYNRKTNFDRELLAFTDSVKLLSGDDSIYTAYTAGFYSNTNGNDLNCFILGFIVNADELSSLNPNYIYHFSNQTLVASIDTLQFPQLAEEMGFTKISAAENTQLHSSLNSGEHGRISYVGKVLSYCNVNGRIEKLYYDMKPE